MVKVSISIEERNRIIETEFSYLLKKMINAVRDYRMIENDDKILVAVSGGKDSLSAMHLLDYLCKKKIFNFEMLVCNVDLGYGCANKKILEEHFVSFRIDYVFVEQNILENKTREEIDCFWCSWNRRKALFETAKKYKCNKVSLGHHLDDIIHTALMNLFFYGEFSTSSPYLELFEGEITLIRPLSYIKEEDTEKLAKFLNLPLPCCACPQKPTSRRTFIKDIFSSLFKEYPDIRENIFNALKKLD
jgi:tRNA 2-thiocytidine biosynthesis protein TtcA